MAVIRLFLLLAVLFGLTLLLVQNWSPVLSVVFLGMRTQSLPLAIWILFSTSAGAFTTVFITSLFKLSNYFAGQQRQTPLKSPATTASRNSTRREEPTQRQKAPPPPDGKTDSRTSNASDDWDNDDSGLNDDWDFEEKQEEANNPSSQNTQVRDSNTYVRQQEPKSGSNSDSVYSYSSREPKNSAVGKTESIYDADYRVIVPPHKSPTTEQAEDDDWGFDDDDFEDKDERSRR